MFAALAFGVIGYFAHKYGFSSAALIPGVILGPLAERQLGPALTISRGSRAALFRSPLALVFHALTLLSAAYSPLRPRTPDGPGTLKAV